MLDGPRERTCDIAWPLHKDDTRFMRSGHFEAVRPFMDQEEVAALTCKVTFQCNPPTPAFAKAGAAPGTTAGVEPVFVGLPLPCLPPAPTRHQGHSHSMSQPHCTRQTLQRSPGLKPLKCLKPSAAAWTRHSGHSPLLLRAFKPTVCQASNA